MAVPLWDWLISPEMPRSPKVLGYIAFQVTTYAFAGAIAGHVLFISLLGSGTSPSTSFMLASLIVCATTLVGMRYFGKYSMMSALEIAAGVEMFFGGGLVASFWFTFAGVIAMARPFSQGPAGGWPPAEPPPKERIKGRWEK